MEELKKIYDCLLSQESREIQVEDKLLDNISPEAKRKTVSVENTETAKPLADSGETAVTLTNSTELSNELMDLAMLVPVTPVMNTPRMIRATSIASANVLLAGETITYEFENVIDFSIPNNDPEKQKLIITNYRILLIRTSGAVREALVSVPLLPIFGVRVEKSKKKGFKMLRLYSSDFTLATFGVPSKIAKKVVSTLTTLANSLSGTRLFAFVFSEKYRENGWNLFNYAAEFERMDMSSNYWRESVFNKDGIFRNYPPMLYVPLLSTDSELDLIKGFSAPPVVSWKKQTKLPCILRAG